MKKHLIAAAVAGALAVPAMAQVTIKGVFDVQAYGSAETKTSTSSTTTTGKTSQTANNNGWATSEIVFGGEEDLGGGLKASFALATGLSNGTSTFADRDRFLALSGGFGTVRMGRVNPAAASGFHGTIAGSTNVGGSLYTLITGAATYSGMGGGMTAGNFERSGSQMLQYTSPSMSGFVVNVNYHTATTADSSALLGEANTTQTGIHLGYSAGPLSIGVATNMRDVKAEGTATVAGVTIEGKLTWLSASYNLGMATVGVARIQREDETTSAAGSTAKNGDISVNAIQVTVPMGAITARASYYAGENDVTAATTDDLDLKGYQVSLNYALSKRTSAYVAMGQNKTERSGTNIGSAVEYNTTGIGVYHSF
jgi:predicted porin